MVVITHGILVVISQGKGKRKKKEGGAKRTTSSFMLFSIENRPSVKDKYPGV